MEQWMGMVLTGECEVLRNNTTVATLIPGTAFGEMAFLQFGQITFPGLD